MSIVPTSLLPWVMYNADCSHITEFCIMQTVVTLLSLYNADCSQIDEFCIMQTAVTLLSSVDAFRSNAG